MITTKQHMKVLDLSDPFNSERELMHRQMMSSVSHDLRTPLASIIGSLEIYHQMNEQLKPEKKKALLETALQEAYRLDNFITNILDMAKLENGQVKAKRERTDIGELLQSSISRLTSKAKDAKININAASGILVATTDAVLLQRVIGLLIDNALKYSGEPSVIDIEYGRGEFAQNYITIRDHGPGIPEHNKDAIFSKYMRVAKQDTQNAGTGLGLSICREIMKILEGSISVQNHADGGAVFTLLFPAG